jgi:hypothetical protein
MAIKDKSQLRADNNLSFPNNNAGAISAADLRNFNDSMITSLVGVIDPFFSGSLQIDGSVSASNFIGNASGLTNITSSADWNTSISNIPAGLVSGSSQVIASQTSGFSTSVKDELNVNTVISGSSQVDLSQATGVAVSASHAIIADNAIEIFVSVKNTSGFDIPKGTAVHSSGVTGDKININTASYDDPNLMPAIGITEELITNNAVGDVILTGRIQGINTSNLTEGATVYVNGDGSLTATRPTGSALIQNIGTCVKSNASEGEILVLGAGRSNDLPNIQSGYLWVGDSNGVPQALPTSSISVDTSNLATTGSNSFNGDQQVTGSVLVSAQVEATQLQATEALITPLIESLGNQVQILDNVEVTGSLGVSGGVTAQSFNGDGSSLTFGGSGILSSSNENFTNYSASVDTRIDSIVVGSGFATTGSNVFNGGQTISGSSVVYSRDSGNHFVVTTGPGDQSPIVMTGGPNPGAGYFGESSITGIQTLSATSIEVEGVGKSGVFAVGKDIALTDTTALINRTTSGSAYVAIGFSDQPTLQNRYIAFEVGAGGSSALRGDTILLEGSGSAGTNVIISGSLTGATENLIVSGNLTLEANRAVEATQLRALESVVSPMYESGTGTVTIGNNTIVSGSLILEPNKPVEATQLTATGELVTPEVNSITGVVQFNSVIKLTGQDPLPTGGVGQLAVSASNLYYHNGTSWAQIN